MKVILNKDKVCKHSVRYTATADSIEKQGLVVNAKQPFSIYVPNALVEPGDTLTVNLSFE